MTCKGIRVFAVFDCSFDVVEVARHSRFDVSLCVADVDGATVANCLIDYTFCPTISAEQTRAVFFRGFCAITRFRPYNDDSGLIIQDKIEVDSEFVDAATVFR